MTSKPNFYQRSRCAVFNNSPFILYLNHAQSRPDIFPPEIIPQKYTIERYHLMGSRILSRSFHVLRWKADGEEPDEEAEVDETEASSALNSDSNAMDVDSVNDHGIESAAPEHPDEVTGNGRRPRRLDEL